MRVVPTFAAVMGAAAIVVAGACMNEPGLDERLAQRIVVTKFDPTANFSSFSTFAVPDTVVFLRKLDGGPSDPSSVETLNPAVADPILREVTSQLTSRGYTLVDRTAGPDLGVAVTAVSQLRTETVQYGEWWDSGSASPSFWGYSGVGVVAPFAYTTFAWRSGTLLIELDDLRGPRSQAAPLLALTSPDALLVDGGLPGTDPTKLPVRIAWAAIIHGVISALGESLQVAPLDSIQQAFAQSPYVRR